MSSDVSGMSFRRTAVASRRRPLVLAVGLLLGASACASLEPLPESAAPSVVPFDTGSSSDATTTETTPAMSDQSAPDAPTEIEVPLDVDDEPAAEGAPTPAPADEPDAPAVDQVESEVDTSGVPVAALLPTAADLGPNWITNGDVVFTIRQIGNGDGACAVPFESMAAELVDAPEAFTVSSGTIVVNAVAARMNSQTDAGALMAALAARDAVTCDGDPNAIVYVETRNGADVVVGSSMQVDGEQGPLEFGLSVVRRGDLVAVAMVLAEAGVHDVESVLWALTDTAVAKMPV